MLRSTLDMHGVRILASIPQESNGRFAEQIILRLFLTTRRLGGCELTELRFVSELPRSPAASVLNDPAWSFCIFVAAMPLLEPWQRADRALGVVLQTNDTTTSTPGVTAKEDSTKTFHTLCYM